MTTISIQPQATSAALEAIAAVQQRTAQARADLATALGALDDVIREKSEQLARLQSSSVSQAQVAQGIADGLRAYLAEGQARLRGVGRSFALLGAYRTVVHFGVISGDGSHMKDVKRPHPLDWHGMLAEPSGALSAAALALVLDDAGIEAFAEHAARESGAPETGPSIDELDEQARELADELEALHEDRFTLHAQLKDFIEMSVSPMVPNSFFNRQPSAEGAPSSADPTVRYLDEEEGGIKVRSGDALRAHYDTLAMDAATTRAADAAAGLAPPWDKPLWDDVSTGH